MGGVVGGSDHGSGIICSGDSHSNSGANDECGDHAGSNNYGSGIGIHISSGDMEITSIPVTLTNAGGGAAAVGVGGGRGQNAVVETVVEAEERKKSYQQS